MSVDRDGEFESAVRSNVGVTIGDWWKMVIYVDIDGQEVTAAGHDSILYS